MKIRLAPATRGMAIGILVAVILFIIALFMIIYLLINLLRMSPRQFPSEGSEYAQYLFEADPEKSKYYVPEAPPGMRYREVPILSSTNLIQWETMMCRVDANGIIHPPDGSALQLNGDWSEESQQWTALYLSVLRPGTNGIRGFRLP